MKRPRMSRAQGGGGGGGGGSGGGGGGGESWVVDTCSAADVRGFALPEDSVEGGSGGIMIDPSAAVVQVRESAAVGSGDGHVTCGTQVSGAAGDAAKKELERKVKRIGMTLVQVSIARDEFAPIVLVVTIVTMVSWMRNMCVCACLCHV